MSERTSGEGLQRGVEARFIRGRHLTAARGFYNLAVNEFNASLRQFPANLVRTVTRLARRKAFDIGAQHEALEAPIVMKNGRGRRSLDAI